MPHWIGMLAHSARYKAQGIIEEVFPDEGGARGAPLDASLDRHVVSLCQVKGPGHH